MRIEITDETRRGGKQSQIADRRSKIALVRPRVLKKQLEQVVTWLKYTHGNWSISLMKDAAMRRLHQQVMDDPRTTDVLTFDLRDAGLRKTRSGKELDLDTVICVDEARRRADELDVALHDEVLLYAVHSLLHVSGYDDVTPTKAGRMHRREDELLVRLGVGVVYARSGQGRQAAE